MYSSAGSPAPKPVQARPTSALNYDSDSDGQAAGGRRGAPRGAANNSKGQLLVPLPTSTGLAAPAGQLLKGATTSDGKLKDASLLLGIKLDLEAEVHLTARVKGDVVVGLY
ncbi:unnamed protein product [Clonostachys rhizophaga]|uniref:Uncharacterized protein n=1 Tax=Clonostachys rhizophaga TaxID=160324 RepID=A0A9N9V664_9HYPO|nr:unnamed protein product [Clonostachys rhizophaga]